MMRFNFTISHVPGKQLAITDMLSRSPIELPDTDDYKLELESQAFVNTVIETLPASEQQLQRIQDSQQ